MLVHVILDISSSEYPKKSTPINASADICISEFWFLQLSEFKGIASNNK